MMNIAHVLLISGGEGFRIRESVKARRAIRFRLTQKPTLCEALDALQESSFDLILVDLSLSDASVAESVTKTILLKPDLPVIALVGEGEASKALEAISVGVKDYVLKGCQCDALVQTMYFALERKQLLADSEETRRRMKKDKEELVAHLSHEVRNGLACIHQFGNILVDGLAGELSLEQREYLGIMLENGSRIRTVLDNLLEAAPGAE